MKEIVVRRQVNDDIWTARFSDEEFGDWIPTCFLARAPFDQVRERLERINPGFTVRQVA